MGMGCRRHASAALLLGMPRYPLYSKLGEPQGWSGRVPKISPAPGFDPRTVQSVGSRYTDCAIPNFDVLLTVHLSIILVINQLNVQILV